MICAVADPIFLSEEISPPIEQVLDNFGISRVSGLCFQLLGAISPGTARNAGVRARDGMYRRTADRF